MTVVRGRALRRWALVAGAAALLCAAPAVVAALPTAQVTAPPAALRADILASAAVPYQGYAESDGHLGLPALPQLSDVASLLSSPTTTRVWYAAPNRNRVDVVTAVGGERDVYQAPDAEYTWDFGTNLVTKVVGTAPVRLPRAGDLLPPDLARRLLAADGADPLTALPSRRVAGITAVGVRLAPTDPATTVGRVDIWADPATGLPLRVEVTPRGAASPVLVTQFLDLNRAAPAASVLAPPSPTDAGFTVTDVPDVLTALGSVTRRPLPERLAGYPRQPQLRGLPGVGRYGAGLATFVVVPLPGNLGGSALDAMGKAGARTVAVSRGTAEVISIPLLSVLVDRPGGRRAYLLAGPVDPGVLAGAAAALSTPPSAGQSR